MKTEYLAETLPLELGVWAKDVQGRPPMPWAEVARVMVAAWYDQEGLPLIGRVVGS